MENEAQLAKGNSQVDYLTGLEDSVFQFVHATPGQRFLNFVVDNIVMRLVMSYATGYFIGILIVSISPGFLNGVQTRENLWGFFFLSYLIGCLNYTIYYTLCEKLFRGHTLGKLMTGTRAIRTDGSELSFKNSLLRSVCRLVPFEIFSAFGGHPWHDTWTNTMVIKSR